MITIATGDLTGILADAAEEWRPVIGREGLYEVSSLGQVSRQGSAKGARPSTRPDGRRILRATPANHGYPQVSLCRDGKAEDRRRKTRAEIGKRFTGAIMPVRLGKDAAA